MKEALKELAKKNIDFFVKTCIIKEEMTGKVIIEINMNQGGVRDGIVIKTEQKH